VDEREKTERAIVDDLRKALRAAPLEGTTLSRTFGEPTLIQVTRPGDGGELVTVVSITVRGTETKLPAPKQARLPGTEEAIARPKTRAATGSAPKAASVPEVQAPTAPAGAEGATLASLGLVEVRAGVPVERAREVLPRVAWREVGGGRVAALVGAEALPVLRAATAFPFTSAPFDPSLDVPLAIEVWSVEETHAELAAQLAPELVAGAAARTQIRYGESFIELPASSDEARLAWAVAYLRESSVPFWVRPAKKPRTPREKSAGGAR